MSKKIFVKALTGKTITREIIKEKILQGSSNGSSSSAGRIQISKRIFKAQVEAQVEEAPEEHHFPDGRRLSRSRAVPRPMLYQAFVRSQVLNGEFVFIRSQGLW
jgi:hypothetical protein